MVGILMTPTDKEMCQALRMFARNMGPLNLSYDYLNAAADRIEALSREVYDLRLQETQKEYPCSPHCAGYLRERATIDRANAAEAEVVRLTTALDAISGFESPGYDTWYQMRDVARSALVQPNTQDGGGE